MKPSSLPIKSLVAALAVSVATLVPTTVKAVDAYTDPVGFITLGLAGAVSGDPSYSFAGLSMSRAVEYQGSAETVGVNTVTDNEATWANDAFNGAAGAYYLEITSGSKAGTTYDITATNAGTKTITLAQNLAAGVANGVTFKVRKHWTIASVFGATNSAGLQGGDSNTADQVFIYNPDFAAFTSYYYQGAGVFGGVGWRTTDDAFTDVSANVVYPDDGLIVYRQSAGNLNVVLMGSVKLGQTSIPIQPGFNLVSNVFAAPMTVASTGLYTGNASTGLADGDSNTADQVFVWNGVSYTSCYYQGAGVFGGTGWRTTDDSFADASTTSIGVGTAFFVSRTNPGAFNWVAPQHPASL
jgi:uncharacterized protein (TIGR02597 family)